MINLSDRLKKIADEIEAGETVADIGTDHGFLPIYLWENGKSPKVIMTDVSAGSLEKAHQNCTELHPDVHFDLRLGSGLEVIEPAEVDSVVLAGMGGILMSEILGADIEKARSYKKLILQPRTDVGKLRFWLYDNGFKIINEGLVRERKFICEILTVIPREIAITRQMNGDDIEYEFPHSLVDYGEPLLGEYLEKKKAVEEKILANMQKAREQDPLAIRHQEYRVSYIDYLIRANKRVNG